MKHLALATLMLSITACGDGKTASLSSSLVQLEPAPITIAFTYSYASQGDACTGGLQQPCTTVKRVTSANLVELQSRYVTCAWVPVGAAAYQVTCPANCQAATQSVACPIILNVYSYGTGSAGPSPTPSIAPKQVTTTTCAPPQDASATECKWEPALN